jgi:serine/threonine-protein kinase
MSATDWAPGQLIVDRYRLEAHIGEGGFGAVFRATELKLDRPVALKALREEVMGRDDVEGRFHREAQLAKQLEHPNTVRLLDFGTASDGTPFIVYELLKGLALDEYLRAHGALSDARVARVTTQVLKSLMEAHQHGIVHRDIKPSNIFLCEFSGEKDFVKVLDFGIAKSEAHKHAPMTRVGMAIGTPSYMAPEQVHGIGVGAATDLYALGLVMAEALTGRVIVSAPTPALTAVEQASDKPVPLPPKVLQSPLGPVVLRSTQKAIARRYASAEEMLDQLATVQLPAAGATAVSSGNAAPSAEQELAHARTSWTPQVSPQAATNLGYAPPHASPHAPPYGPPQGPPHGLPSQQQASGQASGPYASPSGIHGHGSAPGYGSYGSPPIYGPPPAPYAPAPERPSTTGSGLMVLFIVGGGLLAVVVLIALAVIVGVSSSKGSASGDDETTSDAPDDRPVASLDQTTLEKRLTDAGWDITGRSETNGQGFQTFSIQVSKGSGGGGVVQFYRYEDERIADAVEDGLRKIDNGAYVRNGGTMVFVVVNVIDGGEVRNVSRDVLDDLRISR